MSRSPLRHASPYTRHHEALDNHANEQDIATCVLRLARNGPEQIEGARTTPRPLRTRTRTSSRQMPEQTISHEEMGGFEPRNKLKRKIAKSSQSRRMRGTKILKRTSSAECRPQACEQLHCWSVAHAFAPLHARLTAKVKKPFSCGIPEDP
jgi:hypothetical protein